MDKPEIQSAEGRLGVLLPGMGAVATTFIAGVEAVRQGISRPFGSLTQMNTIRLGRRTEGRAPLIKDFAPLASHPRRRLREHSEGRGPRQVPYGPP
jgi:myo-inositol-1-phosphate synthase